MSKKRLYLVIMAFILTQSIFIFYKYFYEPKHTEITCTSSFIRNIIGESDSYFSGEMTLTLKRTGKGNLTVEGKINKNKPRIFHKAFFFDYYLDELGILHGKIYKTESAKNDMADDTTFGMKFIELDFQLRGGLRIHQFKSVYILSVPGLIINTCVPV